LLYNAMDWERLGTAGITYMVLPTLNESSNLELLWNDGRAFIYLIRSKEARQ